MNIYTIISEKLFEMKQKMPKETSEIMEYLAELCNMDITLYENLWEYVKDADFTNHEWHTESLLLDDNNLLVTEWDITDDANFTIDDTFTITINGIEYVYVNYLEDDISFIRKDFYKYVTLAFENCNDFWGYALPYKDNDDVIKNNKEMWIYVKDGDNIELIYKTN